MLEGNLDSGECGIGHLVRLRHEYEVNPCSGTKRIIPARAGPESESRK
jgi:hypothetical protein